MYGVNPSLPIISRGYSPSLILWYAPLFDVGYPHAVREHCPYCVLHQHLLWKYVQCDLIIKCTWTLHTLWMFTGSWMWWPHWSENGHIVPAIKKSSGQLPRRRWKLVPSVLLLLQVTPRHHLWYLETPVSSYKLLWSSVKEWLYIFCISPSNFYNQ